jgi:hypothetical protein
MDARVPRLEEPDPTLLIAFVNPSRTEVPDVEVDDIGREIHRLGA